MTTERKRYSRYSWISWVLLMAGGVLLAVTGSKFVVDSRQAFEETKSVGVDLRLTDVQPQQSSWLLDQEGGHWGRYGWYLDAGQSGALRLALPGSGPGKHKIRVWAFTPGALSVTYADGPFREEISLGDLDGGVLEKSAHGPAEILVASSNTWTADQLVLDRFAAAWFPSDRGLPSPWPLAAALGIGFFGWSWQVICQKGTSDAWRLLAGTGGILLAAMVGFAIRWELFDMVRALPLEPDAQKYWSYAKVFEWFTTDHGFYSATFNEREPLHVALLDGWFRVWGQSAPAVILYTIWTSTCLIAASGFFFWVLTSQWAWGVLIAWTLALSPAWVHEAVRGLRLEGLTLLLLTVLGIWLWARGPLASVWLGLSIGGMGLTQSTSFSFVLPLIWGAWVLNVWRTRRGLRPVQPSHWKWPRLALATAIAIGMFLPHLYGMYKVHGDPSWPSYGYARWNANMEFPDRMGTEGFPSAQEFEISPYAGPPLKYSDYLFKLHTVPQLIYGQIKGWIESTLYMSASHTPGLKNLIFLQQASGIRAMSRHLEMVPLVIIALSLACMAVGWVNLLKRPDYWWVPVLSLLGTWHAAYLYSVRLVEPFRHTAHIYPLLLFCLLWGAHRIAPALQGFSRGQVSKHGSLLWRDILNRPSGADKSGDHTVA
ncbi:hypothetical protein W02_13470 [Nitrospira sp. KM1]|uniref:hypothetical protein n=1 Tax=Nitrospira sp. KM1 TaxID=1936990 RepID=UPI0013A72A29|nr:hypothetical protein [Nitrospira sp. KM1]BCA54207.1 hypothetical protein W02_13470 [Nitrospira sp. KM1]